MWCHCPWGGSKNMQECTQSHAAITMEHNVYYLSRLVVSLSCSCVNMVHTLLTSLGSWIISRFLDHCISINAWPLDHWLFLDHFGPSVNSYFVSMLGSSASILISQLYIFFCRADILQRSGLCPRPYLVVGCPSNFNEIIYPDFTKYSTSPYILYGPSFCVLNGAYIVQSLFNVSL